MSTTADYLKTLRRIPDDVILSVATRDLELDHAQTCLCGWAVREAIARASGIADADMVEVFGITWKCQDAFGGSSDEWADIFWGVVGGPASEIECAFVERVLEAVS
jgi:hypothetical protein